MQQPDKLTVVIAHRDPCLSAGVAPHFGIHSTDRLLAGNREPPLGSHLVTPRRGFLHHGIYVGGRKVVHYSGLAHGLRGGPVEEVSLSHFASRQYVWIRSNAPSDFDIREVIYRARSRVGEDCYRLLTNNCEHFCEWCLRGKPRSLQVEAWLAWPTRTLLAALRSICGNDAGRLVRTERRKTGGIVTCRNVQACG